jgi:hypothetical protein
VPVYEELEILRAGISGKLFTSTNETLKFITTNPFRSWLQSEYTDFVQGDYSTDVIDITSESGKILQKGQDSATDWAAGTNSNCDLTTEPGTIMPAMGAATDYVSYPYILGGQSGFWVNYYTFYQELPGVDFLLTQISLWLTRAHAGTDSTLYVYVRDETANVDYLMGQVNWSGLISGYVKTDFANQSVIMRTGHTYSIKMQVTGGTAKIWARGYLTPDYTGNLKMWTGSKWYNVTEAEGDDRIYHAAFILTGKKWVDGAYLITQPIDYGFKPTKYGNCIMSYLFNDLARPNFHGINLYIRTSADSATWSDYVLVGTVYDNVGDCCVYPFVKDLDAILLAAGVSREKFLQYKILFQRSPLYSAYQPKVKDVSYGGEIILQEKDFTANIVDWGILSYNYEGSGAVTFRLHTYDSPGTAYDDDEAVDVVGGTKITALIKQYGQLKVILNGTNYNDKLKVLDVTINWLNKTGQTRNYVFRIDLTGEHKRIKSLKYNLGNPACNYAIVNVNPYVPQAYAVVWTYNEADAIANAETKTIIAYYSNATIKSSGGTLRKITLTLDAVSGDCSDGATVTINSCSVSFRSGGYVGTITITNNSGGNRTITALTATAIALFTAETAKRKTICESKDDASIALYGNKVFVKRITNKYISSPTAGQNLVDTLVLNDKYAKGYISELSIPLSVNMTTGDIVSLTHDSIKTPQKQTIPIEINRDGYSTKLQCVET